MPELPCEPFVQCTQLDARLLISTALQGPPIAGDMGEIPLGRFTAQGAAIRPYVDVRLEQVWVAKEACYGPIRSIFSLAPGEHLHTGRRRRIRQSRLAHHAGGVRHRHQATPQPRVDEVLVGPFPTRGAQRPASASFAEPGVGPDRSPCRRPRRGRPGTRRSRAPESPSPMQNSSTPSRSAMAPLNRDMRAMSRAYSMQFA